MSFQTLLKQFCKILERHKIRYLLTGGLASGFYGFPRTTHDIDFLVEVEEESVRKLYELLTGLGKSYLVSAEQLKVKIKTPEIVTVFHFKSGVKIDFWIVDQKHFTSEWSRRNQRTFLGQRIMLVSPEDLILTKLSWCKEAPSERHLRDCIGIWKVQKETLDLAYLRTRAKELEIISLLGEISEADY